MTPCADRVLHSCIHTMHGVGVWVDKHQGTGQEVSAHAPRWQVDWGICLSHINWSTVWWWDLACLTGLCSLLGGACWWGTCRGGGCRTSVNVGTWVQRRARGLCYLVPLPRYIGALPLIVLVAINQKLQLLMHRVRCGQRGLPARRNVKNLLCSFCVDSTQSIVRLRQVRT